MRRNGRESQRQQNRGNVSHSGPSTQPSGLVGIGLAALGGLGIGAGLLYLLDPDKGQKRRRNLWSGARHLGSTIADRASHVASSAKDYASEKYEQAKELASGYLPEPEPPAWHRKVGMAVCALGSMALGAAAMYLFDPVLGNVRRWYAKEYARDGVMRAKEAIAGTAEDVKDQFAEATESQPSGFSTTAPQM